MIHAVVAASLQSACIVLHRERGRSGGTSGGLGGSAGGGETELQLQRRRIRTRIKALKKQLGEVGLRKIHLSDHYPTLLPT